MNKDLRLSRLIGGWGGDKEILVEYLKRREVYENGFTGRTPANPYAWGTVLNFDKFETEIRALIASKSLKIKRLESIAESMSNDINSPIVRLSGLTLQRLLKTKIESGHDDHRNESCRGFHPLPQT